MSTTEKGRAAELVAEKHLEAEGYKILERNFRTRRAEIDLIAIRGKFLLFVEVKGRATFNPDEAWLPFWRKKKWKIYAAARVFLRMHPEIDLESEGFGLEILYITQGRVIERFEEGGFF
ncbi:MAG: YraN family protein [Bdellovibrionota bacterium]